MADEGSDRLSRVVSCFSFNADRTQVALSPNDNTIEIYQVSGEIPSRWKKIHTLTEHDNFVSDLDWSPVTNRIVSSGHDRNAYVWNLQEDGTWSPTLVILRINRAANCVRWSPNGDKFAVGSGAKTVPVCHYEETGDWWVSKMIKKHKSSVLTVAWHPNNKFLLTGGSDFKCRLFSAFVDDVDTKDDEGVFASIFPKQHSFGALLHEFDQSKGWVEHCTFAPGGFRAAFAGHDSSLTFVNLDPGSGVSAQPVLLKGLPFRALGFLDDNHLVAAGHDANPLLFSASGADNAPVWEETCKLDKEGKKAEKKTSNISAARKMFQQASNTGVKFGTKSDNKLKTRHQNAISCMTILDDSTFVTSGLDGRVLYWHMEKIMSS